MLHQWLQWASGKTEPPQIVWEKEGRFYDPFRPAVELNGFAAPEEVFASRQVTTAAVYRALKEADVLVFTLGLTEAWQDIESGIEFAICPGVAAGEFDAARHSFVNHGFQSTYKNLKSAVQLARRLNPRLKVLLTVSPVPLTATASGEHVLTASSLSKSVLRAVADQMKTISPHVDYFPSYEIITQPAFRGMFFDPNMRTVTGSGVGFVMESFFSDQAAAFSKTVKVQRPYGVIEEKTIGPEQALPKKIIDEEQDAEDATEALLCEEEMLNAFGK
ncbi:GSCFA domain-containing protein [Roseobacter weihaiensis]|uniref:GSCFA domain-containing protein n=1 Tax=Roseobacter weihaiensis TaxID=2763262 RepID=UPI0022221929|nr:GSCFA domain-containing protein [Roseobacter sp. H9]